MRATPVRYKYHAPRHWCASSMLAEGVALPVVTGHIGDHQHTIIRGYTHWLRDDQSRAPAPFLTASPRDARGDAQDQDANTGPDQGTDTSATA